MLVDVTSPSTSQKGRACLTCLERVPEDASRCPKCDSETLDLAQESDRELLRVALQARGNAGYWAGLGALVGALGSFAVPGVNRAQGDWPLWLGALAGALVGYFLALVLRPRKRTALELAVGNKGEQSLLPRIVTGAPVLLGIGALAAALVTFRVPELRSAFALRPDRVREGAELWGLATHALVHAGTGHLAANVGALVILGTRLDLRIGRVATLLVFAVGVLGGGVVHALFTSRPDAPLVGMSDGVFALAGALVVVLPNAPTVMGGMGVVVPMPMWLRGVLLVTAFAALDAIARPEIAVLGHLGGAAAGALAGLIARRVTRESEPHRAYERRIAAHIARIS